MKYPKNHFISLKGNNSLCSDRFPFFTLHCVIFFTGFHEGRCLTVVD